jgi:predicted transcriptional regulator
MSTCNQITNFLIKKYNLTEKTTFGEAIYETRKQDKIVNYYWDDLHVFLDLRNVLVHKQYGIEVLANPSKEVIDSINKIRDKIMNPVIIGALFKQKVISFDSDDSLDKVLNYVRSYDYTQFPIFSGRTFLGLLSENGIARWLSRMIENDVISLRETKISEVMSLEECKSNYLFISPSANIYEVDVKFANGYKNNNKTLVLLITNKQNPIDASDFTGIITYADLQLIKNHI